MFIDRNNTYKDEPENGVEVAEHHDSDDEDNFKYRSTRKSSDSQETNDFHETPKSQASPSIKKSPSRKIDLGAAANYAGSTDTQSSAANTSNSDFADFTSAPVSGGASTMNDLADILTTPLPQPNIVPLQSPSASTGGANVDLFGDFSVPGMELFSFF